MEPLKRARHFLSKAMDDEVLLEVIISNKKIRPFLEEKFPKEGGYSEKTANSIRAGVTSRMVELKLIKIEEMGG